MPITPIVSALFLLWAIRDKKNRESIFSLMLVYFLSANLILPLIQGIQIVTSVAGLTFNDSFDSLLNFLFGSRYLNPFTILSIGIACLYFFASKSDSPTTIDTNSRRCNIIYSLALLILVKKQILSVIANLIKYNKGSFIIGESSSLIYFGSSFLYPTLTLCIIIYFWKVRGGLWPLAKTPAQARFLLLINVCLGISVVLYLTSYLSTTVMRLTVGIPADASFAVALIRIYAMGITNIALGAFIIATEIMRFISWRTPSADDAHPQTAS